jgi:malate dehydrogenase (oxaloacetate-decarboxylating)
VILGAGSAAIGVADMIRAALIDDGLPPEEASRFWFLDDKGLLRRSRTDLTPEQRIYARDDADVQGWSGSGLAEVVRRVKPTALIGLSTAHGAFTEPVVRQMAATCERPVIFPLSNPTSHSEAEPADLAAGRTGRRWSPPARPFRLWKRVAGTSRSRRRTTSMSFPPSAWPRSRAGPRGSPTG